MHSMMDRRRRVEAVTGKAVPPSPVEGACAIWRRSAACCCAAVGPPLALEVCWAADVAAAVCGWAGAGQGGSLRWPRQRLQCPSAHHSPRAPGGSLPPAREPQGPAPPSTLPSSASAGACHVSARLRPCRERVKHIVIMVHGKIAATC